MRKLTTLLTGLALLSTVAMAQETPAPAPSPPVAPPDLICEDLGKVSKGKGVMLMPLRDPAGVRTLEIPFSTAKACEEERCRLKALNIAAQCVWQR